MANQYYPNCPTVYDEMIGQTFGRLTVLEVIKGIAPSFTARLKCQCICGKITTPTGISVKNGTCQSCGCLRLDRVREANITHGKSRTPEHCNWSNMLNRCNSPNHPKYYMYGGRGITVCPEWQGKQGFESFLEYMGIRPSPQHSVDRHPDKNGNYEPGNVRWATPPEQQRNMRSNHMIAWNGETLCLADWSIKLGIPDSTLGLRLKKWPLERAMTEPIHTECHNKS